MNRQVVRLNANLRPEAADALEDLARRIGGNKTTALHSAIMLADLLYKEADNRATISVKRIGSQARAVVLPKIDPAVAEAVIADLESAQAAPPADDEAAAEAPKALDGDVAEPPRGLGDSEMAEAPRELGDSEMAEAPRELGDSEMAEALDDEAVPPKALDGNLAAQAPDDIVDAG
jgi:hypothetical protein